MDKKGRLIVIDGLDGCGKTTQHERLLDILTEKGLNVRGISFPDYDKPSAALVKMYLGGEFSENAADVNAYAASCFYAADRYASFKLYWEKDYSDGGVILASRYVSSNAVHQCPKLPEGEWDEFLRWLDDFEYERLALPRPDKIIFLDITPELSAKRLSGRYNGDESKKDIHESNMDYMRCCRKAALYAAQRQSWSVVSCSDKDGREKTPEEITKELLGIISEVI
ncbi:MAG: deoxynucleoside kinase [Oscillospiraceae bacterium]|nr:deoxynucleoside kinase [Oscillospiraceae bacterium]